MAGRNTVEIILSAQDRASGAIRAAFGSVEESNNRMTGALKAGVAVAAGAFAALGGYVAKVGVDYDAMAEQSQVAWTTLLGSQQKAKQMLSDIANFAKATPFETEQVDAMAKYFTNAGYAGKGLFDQLMRISDVSSAFNITTDNAKELARQMSQVDQAQVAYTSDLDILQNQGVPIFKAIAAELNTNVAAVRKMASNGQISADIYNKAFDSIADHVKGASDAQSQTFNGLLSTLSDNLKMISGALAKPLFDTLKSGLTTVMPLLGAFTSLAKGQFKDFSDQIIQAFGSQTGSKIITFVQEAQKDFQMLGKYLDQGKQALKALFDFIKGDNIGGISILTKMGLSTKTIVEIDHVINDVKSSVLGFGKWVSSTFASLFSGKNDIGSSFSKVFNTIKSIAIPILTDIVDFVKNGIARIKQFWDKDGAQIIQGVKDSINMLADVFKALAPVLKVVWDSVKLVGTVAFNLFMDAVTFLGGKMDWVIPILGGVVAAIGAFKIINTIIDLYKSWQIVTKLMTVAQAALDLVLDANPIGLIAIAIGALITAGILLYQNWDTVKQKMAEIWLQIERGAASMVNGIIDKLDWLIDKINSVSSHFGITIPKIPHVDWGQITADPGTAPMGRGKAGGAQAAYASGTDNATPGVHLVGENGPELLFFNGGEQVKTASETKRMLNGGSKGNTYNLKVVNNQNMDEQTLIRYLQRMEALNPYA